MSSLPLVTRSALAGACSVAWACASPLPDKTAVGASPGVPGLPDAAAPPALRFDPAAPADAVTPVTRMTIEFGEPLADPHVLLATGALTASQLRDFGKSIVSQVVASRAVSTIAWLEPDAKVLVVAPIVRLEPGALYTLALSAPLVSFPFRVAGDARPALVRVWPDRDEVAPSASAAVWCGSSDLAALDEPATLEPALLSGRFSVGTGAPFAAPRCVSWFSAMPCGSDAGAPPAVAPPALTFDDGTSAPLEPTVLFDRAGPEVASATCVAPSISFGPGCADVEDDRIVVYPGLDPLLWTLDFGQTPLVRSTRGGASFTVRPLPVDGGVRISTLDPSGRVMSSELSISPAAPRPHVVLNEVLANPAGAEPAEEWIELYNDGSAAVSLAGFSLEDAGGRTPLPDATIAPGAFALVVSDAYVEDDGVDPAPAPGTALVRVPELGRSGLSNEGEKLTLRDAAGVALSTFPAVKTKNGVSASRVAPDAPDSDPASFVASRNGSSTPGAPNLP